MKRHLTGGTRWKKWVTGRQRTAEYVPRKTRSAN
jgi:hypothetical protein